jgi:hypothetical protein
MNAYIRGAVTNDKICKRAEIQNLIVVSRRYRDNRMLEGEPKVAAQLPPETFF